MAGEETDKPKHEKKQRGEIVDIVAHVKKLEEDLIPRTITEKLSRLSDIWIEEYTSPSGLAGAVAHFGQRIPRAEMDAFVKPILDARPQKDNGLENKPVGYDHGFGAVWRTPDEYTQDEIDNDTFETALRLARRTLRLKGWSARDVDVVDFANSAATKGM